MSMIPRQAPDVPKDDVDAKLFGRNLTLDSNGRGVEGGVPYGEQLHAERDEVQAMHGFTPGAAAKLRAATKRALGRA